MSDEDRILDQELAEEPQDNSVDVAIIPPPQMKMTEREANAAARDAGMRTMKARKFKGVADFGRWVEQCGAFRIGLGMLAFTAEQLQDGIEKCAELDKEIKDPEIRAHLMGINRDLTEQYIDIGKSLLKASEKMPVQSQPPVSLVPAPPPGIAVSVQKGGAVQINTAQTDPPK